MKEGNEPTGASKSERERGRCKTEQKQIHLRKEQREHITFRLADVS